MIVQNSIFMIIQTSVLMLVKTTVLMIVKTNVLTLSLREAAHSVSGVLAMGREAAVSGLPIYPGQF